MAVNVAMATVITANIRNALSVTSCALRSVIDAIPRLLRHSDSGVAPVVTLEMTLVATDASPVQLGGTIAATSIDAAPVTTAAPTSATS
jgi:hypothetical protein